MVAGLPNVLEHVCFEHRHILQFLTSLESFDKLSARSLARNRRNPQPSVIGRSYQRLGLLSGWSERIDDTEVVQPPT